MPLLEKSSCGIRFGGVAQWLVQRLHKALVGGSNPPSATINLLRLQDHKSTIKG